MGCFSGIDTAVCIDADRGINKKLKDLFLPWQIEEECLVKQRFFYAVLNEVCNIMQKRASCCRSYFAHAFCSYGFFSLIDYT